MEARESNVSDEGQFYGLAGVAVYSLILCNLNHLYFTPFTTPEHISGLAYFEPDQKPNRDSSYRNSVSQHLLCVARRLSAVVGRGTLAHRLRSIAPQHESLQRCGAGCRAQLLPSFDRCLVLSFDGFWKLFIQIRFFNTSDDL